MCCPETDCMRVEWDNSRGHVLIHQPRNYGLGQLNPWMMTEIFTTKYCKIISTVLGKSSIPRLRDASSDCGIELLPYPAHVLFEGVKDMKLPRMVLQVDPPLKVIITPQWSE